VSPRTTRGPGARQRRDAGGARRGPPVRREPPRGAAGRRSSRRASLPEIVARLEALERRLGRLEAGRPPPGDGRGAARPAARALRRCSGCGLPLRVREGRCAWCGRPR